MVTVIVGANIVVVKAMTGTAALEVSSLGAPPSRLLQSLAQANWANSVCICVCESSKALRFNLNLDKRYRRREHLIGGMVGDVIMDDGATALDLTEWLDDHDFTDNYDSS